MNENEKLWSKDQQQKCKLCSNDALQGWRYANMCQECYDLHRKAMDMLNCLTP
jgi:hypothetical protein